MYWKKSLGEMHVFITSKDGDNLEVHPRSLYGTSACFCDKEEMRVPTIQLEKPRENKEDHGTPNQRDPKKRKETFICCFIYNEKGEGILRAPFSFRT